MQGVIFHWIAHFGYIGMFGSLVLGIVGLPVPDELLMTFSGYLIFLGKMNYLLTLIVGVAGSISGMSISYYIGWRFGYPILHKYGPKIHITHQKLEKTHAWFERFGKFAVTVGYFVPGLRHLASYFAGIGKWPYRTFIAFALPGAMIWCFSFITLGRTLGKHWKVYADLIHKYMLSGFLILVAIGGICLLIRAVARKTEIKS